MTNIFDDAVGLTIGNKEVKSITINDGVDELFSVSIGGFANDSYTDWSQVTTSFTIDRGWARYSFDNLFNKGNGTCTYHVIRYYSDGSTNDTTVNGVVNSWSNNQPQFPEKFVWYLDGNIVAEYTPTWE